MSWRLLGYKTYVYRIGWNDDEVQYHKKMADLSTFINSLKQSKVNLLGISAGGTVAINALVSNINKVHKVVTVCTPYVETYKLHNKLLNVSIKRCNKSYLALRESNRKRILSIVGIYDQKIMYRSDNTEVGKKIIVPVAIHGVIIFTALTFYLYRIKSFLEND